MHNAVPLQKFRDSWLEAQDIFGKDKTARDALELGLKDALFKIRQNPDLGDFEPCGMTLPEKLEFRKYEFGFKGGKGALAQWRLMYFWNPEIEYIYWFWVYSHKQYPKRPDQKELLDVINSSLREIP